MSTIGIAFFYGVKMKKIFILVLTTLLLFSCASTPNNSNKPANSNETYSVKAEKPQYKGDGVRIAISVPSFGDNSEEKNWIPFYVQDSLTRNFAHYTKMTVLDRTNESVIKAELLLSESGEYSDENAVQYGQLTNAQYLVVGNIMKLQSSYDFSFRINDVETNEIRSTASGRYTTTEIENGFAINEITKQLLEGLEIDLSQEENSELEKTNSQIDFSSQNLARGMVAEKNGNYVEALDFYFKTDGDTQTIAQQNVQLLLNGTIPTDSVKEQAEFLQKQQEKWKKIFKDLEIYLLHKLPVVVYDFSTVTEELNSDLKSARFTIEPGLKIIPNQTAVIVWKEVREAWEKLCNDKNYAPLVQNLRADSFRILSVEHEYIAVVKLFDEDGSQVKTSGYGEIRQRIILKYNNGYEIKSLKKYYNEREYRKITFGNVKLNDIEGNLYPKVYSVEKSYGGGTPNKLIVNPCVYSVEGWENYLKK